jgi:hypothetical protein
MGHVVFLVAAAVIFFGLLAAAAAWMFEIVAIPFRAVHDWIIQRDREKCPTCGQMAVKITGGIEHVHAGTANHVCKAGHTWQAKHDWTRDQNPPDYFGADSRMP